MVGSKRHWQLAVVAATMLMTACLAQPPVAPHAMSQPSATPDQKGTNPTASASGQPAVGSATSPSPPEPQHIAGEWRRYVSPKGYEVVIPANLIPVEEDEEITRFRVAEVTILTISIGDTAGNVTICNAEPCHRVHVRSLSDLGRAVAVYPPGIEMNGEGGWEVTIDGYPGRVKGPKRSGYIYGPQTFVQAYAMVELRPVVMRFSYDYESQEVLSTYRERIVHTFRLHADLQLPLREYISARDGFAISIPRQWVAARTLAGPTRVYWRSEGSPTQWVLTIFIGKSDGTVNVCTSGPCRPIRAGTLDELEASLRSSSPILDSWEEVSGDLVLGGEPARYERPKPINTCLGCPGTRYHVFALHGGRPVVLAFDYWPLRFNQLGAENAWILAQEIVDSFRFL